MSVEIKIIIGIIVLLLVMLSGMPVFVGLGIAGAIGALLFVGFGGLFSIGDLIFESIWHVALLAAPGFILMGNLFFQHGFGHDLFETIDLWLRRIRGGLIIASIWMGALFGFICGSNMAGVATIGKIAIPEVDKRGYDRRLSMGAFAIAGTLSVLIPPSLWMILYAVLAEVSLGDMFFAGIFPGILLTLLLSLYVYIRTALGKSQPIQIASAPWSKKLRSLKGTAPVVITFFVVLGGIYGGLWSVIEASAAGAMIALLFTLAYRRFTWAKFMASVSSTVNIMVMLYMIVISARIWNYFVFVSEMDEHLIELITGYDVPGWVIIIIILFAMSAMGCVFDMMALFLMSISLFLPVVVKLGYDAVWFGVIMIITCELALITPPVGLNLFVIKGMAPSDTTSMDIAAGAIPFVLVVWLLFALLTLFPELVLWLPSKVRAG